MDEKLREGQQILSAAMEAADTAHSWLSDNAEALAEQGIEWIQTEEAEGNHKLAEEARQFSAKMAGILAEFPLQEEEEAINKSAR